MAVIITRDQKRQLDSLLLSDKPGLQTIFPEHSTYKFDIESSREVITLGKLIIVHLLRTSIQFRENTMSGVSFYTLSKNK